MILEFIDTPVEAQTRKELTHEEVISAGEHLKGEIGAESEFDIIVPEGKQWAVVYNVRLVETNA